MPQFASIFYSNDFKDHFESDKVVVVVVLEVEGREVNHTYRSIRSFYISRGAPAMRNFLSKVYHPVVFPAGVQSSCRAEVRAIWRLQAKLLEYLNLPVLVEAGVVSFACGEESALYNSSIVHDCTCLLWRFAVSQCMPIEVY